MPTEKCPNKNCNKVGDHITSEPHIHCTKCGVPVNIKEGGMLPIGHTLVEFKHNIMQLKCSVVLPKEEKVCLCIKKHTGECESDLIYKIDGMVKGYLNDLAMAFRHSNQVMEVMRLLRKTLPGLIEEATTLERDQLRAHAEYVQETLDGEKPESAWRTLQDKLDALSSK